MEAEENEESGHFVSDEYLLKLIELVKNYAALYDPQKPDFNNKTMKGFYWREVQRQLEEHGFSPSEAKKAYQRYNSLKKKLLKEQTRLDVMCIPEAQRLERARFRFYKQMMELYPYIEQQNAHKSQAAANFMRLPSQFGSTKTIDLNLLAVIAANSEPERTILHEYLDSPKGMTPERKDLDLKQSFESYFSTEIAKRSLQEEIDEKPISSTTPIEMNEGPTSSKRARQYSLTKDDQIEALVETIGSVAKQLPYERVLPILLTTLTSIQQEIKMT